MAFHLHLINPLSDFIPAAAPQLKRNASRHVPNAPRLSMRWHLGVDGRPRAVWIQD